MTDKPQRQRCPSSSYIRAIDGDVVSNVKVVVRIRPPNAAEQTEKSRIVVHPINENVLVFDPLEQSKDGAFRNGPRDIRKRRNKDMKFAFDYIFGLNSTNVDVFEQTTKTILDGLLQGYNCSVFAYGATGSGKTHTMLGSDEQPGVVYHTMIDLYHRIAQMEDEKTCSVAVSYLEVYNEQIRDLLTSQGGGVLPVREDPKYGVVITGLSLHKPNSAEELLHMLKFGNKNRTQHPTDANAESSRSHAVFQVFIRQKEKTANLSAEVSVAKMCLVDLAGSERAMVTKNRGSRFREGANINRSLLALGNVINALSDNKNNGHIPYRDSKLTRLLKDSLGGNCRTVMIAAVSPSSLSYEDTYNTLKYADRAKHIRAMVKKNILNVDFHVSRYGQIVEELRKEICCLKERVKRYEEGKFLAVGRIACHTEVFRLQDVLYKVFSSRIDIRLEQLSLESMYRDRLLKIHRKEKCLQKLQMLISKVQKNITFTKSKLGDLEKRKEAVAVRFDDNTCWLHKVESEMLMAGGGQVMPEMLEVSLRMHQLEVELSDTRQHVKHLRKVVHVQERDMLTNDRLMMSLLALLEKQHFVLKGNGLMTFDMTSEYDNILRSVERTEVTWADEVTRESTDIEYHVDKVVNLPLVDPLPIKCGTPSRLRNLKQCSTPGVSDKFMATVENTKPSLGKLKGSGDSVPPERVLRPCDPVTPGIMPVRLPQAAQRANSVCNPLREGRGGGQVVQSATGKDCDVRQNSDSLTCRAGHTPAAKPLSLPTAALPTGPAGPSGPSGSPPSVRSSDMSPAQTTPCPNAGSGDTCDDLNSTFTLDDVHHDGTPTISDEVDGDATRTVGWAEGGSDSYFPTIVINNPVRFPKPTVEECILRSDAPSQYRNEPTVSKPNSSQILRTVENVPKTRDSSHCVLASQTVTKPAPSLVLGKENVSGGWVGETKDKKQVARAINFDSVACTPNRTYAQVVKTPPTPERCPLAPLSDNTPTLSPSLMLKRVFTSDGTPARQMRKIPSDTNAKVQHTNSAVPQYGSENIQALHKMGLPSMAYIAQKSTSKLPHSKPSYMQMTKSCAQRIQKVPGRSETDHVPLFKRRSKSTSCINHGRWQH